MINNYPTINTEPTRIFWVCVVAGFFSEVTERDLVIQVYWVRSSHHHHHHHHRHHHHTNQVHNIMR